MTPHDVTLGRAEQGRFTALLQRGVAMRLACPCSVLEFLVDQLGLSPEYVSQRITTVFLDGQVVDLLDRAILRDGSLLALSAAMPGLVGATLRRGGAYAAMRAEITRTPEQGRRPPSGASVLVHVKLFNLLIHELGPVLLEHGVVLERASLDALGIAPDSTAGAHEDGATLDVRVRLQ